MKLKFRNIFPTFLLLLCFFMFGIRVVSIPYIGGVEGNKELSLIWVISLLFKTLFATGGDDFLPNLFKLLVFVVMLIIFIIFLSYLAYILFSKIRVNKQIVSRIDEIIDIILKKESLLIILLFVVSLMVRVVFLNNGLFHHDSAVLGNLVNDFDAEKSLKGVAGDRYGYVLLNLIFYKIVHVVMPYLETDFVLNFFSAVIASLSIVFIYLFLKELTGSRLLGFFSSAVFSFYGPFLSITTYAKSHAFSVLFIVLALYFLVKGLKKSKLGFLYMSSAFLGISLFMRIDSIALVPFYYMLYFFSVRILRKDIDIFHRRNIFAIVAPFFILLVIFLLLKKLTYGNIGSNYLLAFTGFDLDFYFLAFTGFGLFQIDQLIQSISLISIFVVLYYFIYVKKDFLDYLLLFLFVVLFVLFISFKTYNIRFLISIMILFIILIGKGLMHFYSKSKVLSFVLFFLIVLSSFSFIYPTIAFRHSYSSGKEMVKFVDNNVGNNSLIAVHGDYIPFFDFYSDKEYSFVSCTYHKDKEYYYDIYRTINSTLADKEVYIVQMCFFFDPEHHLEDIFSEYSELGFGVVGEFLIDDPHYDTIMKEVVGLKLFKIERK